MNKFYTMYIVDNKCFNVFKSTNHAITKSIWPIRAKIGSIKAKDMILACQLITEAGEFNGESINILKSHTHSILDYFC